MNCKLPFVAADTYLIHPNIAPSALLTCSANPTCMTQTFRILSLYSWTREQILSQKEKLGAAESVGRELLFWREAAAGGDLV